MLERDSLTKKFDRNNFPTFRCSTCSKGFFTVDLDSIVEVEPKFSDLARADENWDPEWIIERFSVRLNCTNNECGEVAFGAGNVSSMLFYDYDTNGRGYVEKYYEFKSIYPAPIFFEIPRNTPDEVTDLLKSSFSIYWHDLNAAMNKIRIAIELILDDQGIKREKTSNDGTVTKLKLHERLQKYEKVAKEPAMSFLAAKEVGNAGSHEESEIDQDIALDVYDFVYFTLIDLYVGMNDKLKSRRDKLIQSRGQTNK